MKTPDKRLFLKMEEHPENYSEEELEAMMDYLDRMADADVAWQEFCCQHNAVAPLSSPLGGSAGTVGCKLPQSSLVWFSCQASPLPPGS